jgi:hypothetical protein
MRMWVSASRKKSAAAARRNPPLAWAKADRADITKRLKNPQRRGRSLRICKSDQNNKRIREKVKSHKPKVCFSLSRENGVATMATLFSHNKGEGI